MYNFKTIPSNIVERQPAVTIREDERVVDAQQYQDIKCRIQDGLRWGVGGVVTNEKGEVLLVCQGDHWTIPGGAVEAGETFSEALSREIQEETGIDIQNEELRTVTEQTLIHEDNQVSFYFATYTATPVTTHLTDNPGVSNEGIDAACWCQCLPEETIDRDLISNLR